MAHEYVLRVVKDGAWEPLRFTLGANGGLAVAGGHAAALRVLRRDAGGLLTVLWGERVVTGLVAGGAPGALEVQIGGEVLALALREAVLDAMEQELAAAPNGGSAEIASPIPGLVKAVCVKVGDAVAAGQTVVVLEAMKMENEIAAPRAGTVVSVKVSPGQAVAAGAAMLEIKG